MMAEEENGLVYPQGGQAVALQGIRKPKEILKEAAEAAKELTKWMKAKVKPVIFNREQYPEFEDWQLAGSFYHLTAKATWTRPIQFGDVMGFEAGADVIDIRTGQVISSAESMCLNEEENWGFRPKLVWMYVLKDGSKQEEDPGVDKIQWEENPFKPGSKWPKKEKVEIGQVKVPLFQLRSMAQTRACAKALRNVLSWIFVLAGFKPAVAEEMAGYETAKAQADQKEAPIGEANQKPSAADPKAAVHYDKPHADPVADGLAKISDAKNKEKTRAAQAPEAGDDVFTTLEKELANYCDGNDAAMQEKLMALTSFPEMKKDADGEKTKEPTGNIIPGKRFVNDLRKSKNGGQRWARAALEKLRIEMAGER